MEWIKKNPHLLTLAILAVALIGSAAFVILNARNFTQNFAKVMETVPPGEKLEALNLKPVEEVSQRLATPAQWVGDSLLVPDRYVIDKDTSMPKKVKDTYFFHDSLTGKPIPNDWFEKNKLSLADPKIPFSDSDKDGFAAEDEWRGNWIPGNPDFPQTDPNNADSHPPYYSKLFLKQFIRVTFRLLFQAYDGDPKKPEEMSFQINAVDRGRKTEFLKLGEKVANTTYQLKKFELKSVLNPNTGEQTDVSELTVMNLETGDSIVLVLTKLTDSPDSYALFTYEWPQSPVAIQVKKLQEFALLPEKEKRYKLLDIQEDHALIQTPTGEKVTIKKDPRL